MGLAWRWCIITYTDVKYENFAVCNAGGRFTLLGYRKSDAHYIFRDLFLRYFISVIHAAHIGSFEYSRSTCYGNQSEVHKTLSLCSSTLPQSSIHVVSARLDIPLVRPKKGEVSFVPLFTRTSRCIGCRKPPAIGTLIKYAAYSL